MQVNRQADRNKQLKMVIEYLEWSVSIFNTLFNSIVCLEGCKMIKPN